MSNNPWAQTRVFDTTDGTSAQRLPEAYPNAGHAKEEKKLVVPEIEMKVLSLRDEEDQKDFLKKIKAEGTPGPWIPGPEEIVQMRDEANVALPFDFKANLDEVVEEMVAKTVAQQEAKLETKKILEDNNLPPELDEDGPPPTGDTPKPRRPKKNQ